MITAFCRYQRRIRGYLQVMIEVTPPPWRLGRSNRHDVFKLGGIQIR